MRDAVGEGGVSVGGSKRNGDNNTLGCLTLHGTDYLVYQTFFNIFFFSLKAANPTALQL